MTIGRQKSADGFILIAVLWILGGLATLAAIYSLYVVNVATGVSANDDRLQGEASISAALELTAYYLSGVEPRDRPSSGNFNFSVGNSRVAVGFRSESARIDLNLAPKPLLSGLFRTLGARSDAADFYADRIIGWRTPATSANPDQDAEITAYRNAGLKYDPRQGPFSNVQELWLVLGLPPALVEHALPYLTVFSDQPTVNVMAAAPDVLAALPGVTPAMLYELLNQRAAQPGDPRPILALLGPAQASATSNASNAVRVAVRVDLPRGRRINAEAVILLLDDAEEPYRVLSWTDDFDG